MLRKVNNSAALQVNDLNHLLMVAYKTVNPFEPMDRPKCRFTMFVRLRPGQASHFRNQSRTGYYPGNKYTDQEPQMLYNLLKMGVKQLPRFDRIVIYDNDKQGEEKEVLKIVNDTIEVNRLQIYSLMLQKFILPQWLTN